MPPTAAAAAAGRCSAPQAGPRAACADPPLARLVAEGVAASGAVPQLRPAARAFSAARVRVASGDGAHVRYVDQPRGPVKRFMLAFLGVSMITRGAGAVRPSLRARLPRRRPPRNAGPRLLGRTRLQVIHASLPSEPPSDRSTPPFAGSVSSRAGGLALVDRLQIASFQPGLMRRAARPRMPRLSPSNHQYCEEGQGQTRSPCFPSPAADHQRSEDDGASICESSPPRAAQPKVPRHANCCTSASRHPDGHVGAPSGALRRSSTCSAGAASCLATQLVGHPPASCAVSCTHQHVDVGRCQAPSRSPSSSGLVWRLHGRCKRSPP